jgi:transposase
MNPTTFESTNGNPMPNSIPLKKRKVLAEEYFFAGKSQIEIAELLDTPANTINRWVAEGDWKKLRDAKTITRDKLVSNMISQIVAMEDLAKQENRILNAKETDSINKLASAIEKLDKKVNISVYIQVFKEFNEYLLKEDLELAKQVTRFQTAFIHSKA